MIKGSPPTPRDSHSCTTVGDNLFVFGGTDGMNPLKDLHILDTCKLFLLINGLFTQEVAANLLPKFCWFIYFLSTSVISFCIVVLSTRS